MIFNIDNEFTINTSLNFSKFLGSEGSAYLHSIPNFFNVCVNKFTVPPYKSVELIKLSPEDIERSNILFVANHAFDCIGAKAWGFRTVFIDRRKRPFGESPHQPDLIVKDFAELATILI